MMLFDILLFHYPCFPCNFMCYANNARRGLKFERSVYVIEKMKFKLS